MPASKRFYPLLVVATLTACGGASASDGNPSAHSWVIDTIGDTVRVRTQSGSVWQGNATLVPEMTIGVFEGEDAYMLGNISAMAVTASGEIYLMDSHVPVLRKYDASGAHLYDLGREGGGPGEYKSADGGLAVLSDGRVLQRDPGNGRMNVYGPDGASITNWRLPGGGGFNTSRKLFRDRQDNTYSMVLAELEADVTKWKYGLVQLTPDGHFTDTTLAPTWDYGRPQISGRREGNSSSTGVPFSPTIKWTFSPAGYMVGSLTTDYRIDLFRGERDVLRIERDYAPIRVTAAERDERKRRITQNFERQFPGWKWNGPGVPDVKPPIRDLFVGDDGSVWVQVSWVGVATMPAAEAAAEEKRTGRPQLRFEEPVVFDVFEAGGRFLGQVSTPEGFSVLPHPVFRRDQVWAVTRDELDVIRVVRFRVQREDATTGE